MNAKARLGWVKLYERTGNATLVCRRCGISAPTLHKWVRRYAAEGRLVSKTAAGAQKPCRKGGSLPNKSASFLSCAAQVSSTSSGDRKQTADSSNQHFMSHEG